MRAERVEQTDRKRRARSQSGLCGQIAVVLCLYAFLHPMLAQNVANCGMVDFVNRLRQFDLRINNAMPMLEKRRKVAKADVAIFVDGGSDHSATVLAMPRGIVRSSAEERNSERSSAHDHARATSVRNGKLEKLPPQTSPRHFLNMPERFIAEFLSDHIQVHGTFEVFVKSIVAKSQDVCGRDLFGP